MRRIFFTIALMMIILAAPAPAPAETALKIGTLPIADTLLLHVAQREGYFSAAGLKVELIAFQGFVEKNAAVQAGELDGHFGEISAVIIQNAAGLNYQVVAATSHTNPEARMFGLVTSPKSKAEKLDDLSGAVLATSKLSIIDFLSDVFLERAGKAGDFMARRNIQKIPVRIQMLTSGQVDAAVLPEPLLSIAENAGGRVIMDDRDLDMPLAVVAIKKQLATDETVAAFQSALGRAAEAINARPNEYRPLLLELRLIPPQLAESFVMPPFDRSRIPAQMPSESLYRQYVQWLTKNKILSKNGEGILPKAPAYRDVIWTGPAAE
ncbi:MetQ/NlpA family ABC transporter substrate-binding protein [Deltaproteobacteria bacterium OttesenSCG-928-K17]|nr:MetQ/NlpA family ABC transporter substrate-binding protein [Deltaproteobacteria bacterium OttesenSCG-928-K17]